MDEQKVEMTLEEQIDNIQEFLKEFDNPLIVHLPEKGQRVADMGINIEFFDTHTGLKTSSSENSASFIIYQIRFK